MADKLFESEAAWLKFFEKADVNLDGTVSIEEMKHVLTVDYGQKLSDQEIVVSDHSDLSLIKIIGCSTTLMANIITVNTKSEVSA
jgi:hypothetical protein